MNLFEKLVELRKSVTELTKDARGYGYDYVSGDQVLSKIRGKMDELSLLLIPQVQVGDNKEWEYTNANGDQKKEILIHGDMSYCWVNAEEPSEKLVIPWAYYGQMDDISKAFGASLTYSERYFLLKFLCMPTDSDDPDAKGVSGLQKKPAQVQQNQSQLPYKQQQKARQYKDAAEVFDLNKNKSRGKLITEAQQKRLYAIAKGDMKLISELLEGFGLSDMREIAMGDQYDAICTEAEERKQKASV